MTAKNDGPVMLRPSEVMRALGISKNTLTKLVANGAFPNASRLGAGSRAQLRVPRTDIDSYLATNRNTPQEKPPAAPDRKGDGK